MQSKLIDMRSMSLKNKILCEVFDSELIDLQLNITLNPTIMRIKSAMDMYAVRTAWDLWKKNTDFLVDAFGQGVPVDEDVDRAKFEKWYAENQKKQNN